VNITGYAGTGKTSLLRTAVAAQRQGSHKDHDDGAEIVVVSMAAATAQRTGQKLEADRWGSVESIVRQVDKGRFFPTSRTMVIVEEAGQMDTLRMDKLLKAVGDARIVLVGDDAQLTPIGAGGWYQDQLDLHGSVELVKVRRHKDPRDTADFELIRHGRAPEALKNMADRGRVHISEDRTRRMADVLADYVEHRNAGWQARDIRMISDTSNADIDTANRFVQRDRLFRGEIREQGFEVHDAEQDRRWSLHEGDQVIFLRSYKIKRDEPVKNGTTGVVMSINADTGRARLRVDQDDGNRRIVTVRLNPHELRQPVGLAYAVHANKYQGAEVPIAQLMPGMGQTTANSAYSMATRSTHETHWYFDYETHGADPIANAGKAMTEREQKQSALSKLAEVRRAEAERVRRMAEQMRDWERQQAEAHEREPQRFEPPAQDPVPPMTEEEVNRLDQALRDVDQDTERLISSAPGAAPRLRQEQADAKKKIEDARDRALDQRLEQRLEQSLDQSLDRGHGRGL
jgi:ATP-dependent exoDNAse (exonuclease V) alpha subunit